MQHSLAFREVYLRNMQINADNATCAVAATTAIEEMDNNSSLAQPVAIGTANDED